MSAPAPGRPPGWGRREVPDREAIAERFHAFYEHLAPQFGYETRPDSAKPWALVPEQNRRLMVATVNSVVTVPGVVFCWEYGNGAACDRAAGHLGPHTWQTAQSGEPEVRP